MRKPNKAIAAITTLAIAASMAAPAFATTISASTGTDTHDIYAGYVKTEAVYSVDISYESMSFTYTEGAWDTATLKYAPGAWSSARSVTVTNSSNAAITATVEAAITAATGADNVTASVDKGATTIGSAAKADPTASGTKQDAKFQVSLSGAPTVRTWDAAKIGTVTVTIAEAAE